jgi:hypothetical protein
MMVVSPDNNRQQSNAGREFVSFAMVLMLLAFVAVIA